MRTTGLLTNTPASGPGRQHADPELHHRRHARAEDQAAKDTGLRNLPFHDLDQNRTWVAVAALAHDLPACTARLALPATLATSEPKRLRLLAVAGRILSSARRRILHIDPAWPWAEQTTTAHARLCSPPAP